MMKGLRDTPLLLEDLLSVCMCVGGVLCVHLDSGIMHMNLHFIYLSIYLLVFSSFCLSCQA